MSDLVLTLSNQLHNREISSLELTKEYIRKIEKYNTSLNAYVHQTFDFAIECAKQADEKLRQGNAHPLCGIPMTLKDNICTDGLLTTCCSKMLSDFRPCYDATAWSRLKEAGAVLLGKTNMDEFAMGSTSMTSFWKAPKNPIDSDRITGGSSGGGAAAVKAGLAPYALGSDTGGSIRQPASYCGVVGFLPSYGSVSRYGLIAHASSLDQIGPITNGVFGSALIFDSISGIDAHDGTSKETEKINTLSSDIKGLKIGFCKEYFEGVDEEVKKAIEQAIRQFTENGAEIIEISMPFLRECLSAYYIISSAEASSNLGRYDGIRFGFRADEYEDINEMIIKSRSQGFGEEVKRRILLGTYVLSSKYYNAYYKKACALRRTVTEHFKELFNMCDVIIAPTSPTTAPKTNAYQNSPEKMYLSDICTVPVNLAGLCAVSVPCGADKNGLPIGMQIISSKEKTALNTAYFYELSGGALWN